MKVKRRIRKILVVGAWLIAGTGMLVLLIAAIRSRNHQVCAGYAVDISGPKEQWFMNKKDVVELLTNNGSAALKGKAIQQIDLRRIEERMEKNAWVRNVELFFDNNEVLQVKVEEKEPVARIFTLNGNSFYIDSSGEHLPLSDKLSARLPVFTSFPIEGTKLNSADSLLMQQIKQVSAYILKDPFWMAQIAQVDITPLRTFEMIPVIGNHIIEFGDGTEYDKKFNRLFRFYRDVLSKAGMNRYERVNVQYARQVIGVKKAAAMSKADSLLAARTVERLIAANSMQQALQNQGSTSTVNNTAVAPGNERPATNSDTVSNSRTTIARPQNPPVRSHPYESSRSVNGRQRQTQQPAGRQPRAVMPGRSH